MTRVAVVFGLVLLALLVNVAFGPLTIRLPLIDWTFDGTHATAGWTLWPIVVVLDVGALGDAARPHEACHWAHHHGVTFTLEALEEAERICTR